MTSYMFLNVPGYGHVNATLAVAKELVRRGERVIYYLTEEFRPAIEATGATFRGYESQMGLLGDMSSFTPGLSPNSKPENPLPYILMGESEDVLPQVFERIHADLPDIILYDVMSFWAKIVVRALHVPAILTRPTFASDGIRGGMTLAPGASTGVGAVGGGNTTGTTGGSWPASGAYSGAGAPLRPAQSLGAAGIGGPEPEKNVPGMGGTPDFFAGFRQIDGRLADLCQAYGVEPFTGLEAFFGSEALNIVFIPKEFQPGGEKMDPQRFVFVGPSLQPRLDTSHFPIEQLKGKTVLYISLGTAMNNQLDFYNICFRAFKDEPWQVVLSIGRKVDPAALDPTPANFIVRPQVPQLEVLQNSSLFVTHCGMNSVMESLYYGVPMVGLPQQGEQMMTARRIQELGLGTSLEMNTLTVEQLRETVKAAMMNDYYRKNVQAMQQNVRGAGGYQLAADAIQNFGKYHQAKE